MTTKLPENSRDWSADSWDENVRWLRKEAMDCRICPHHCKIDRREEVGRCHAPFEPMVSSCNLHFGEEPPISGERGSGTIFFTWCNLRCVFCQNYPISQQGVGNAITVEKLAENMLSLQKRGAHNINFVSPTHYSHAAGEAILMARRRGLTIPIVWNSNGYERIETLKRLEGLIDIYLPDLKYCEDRPARKLSGAPKYWEVATRALTEMQRQVGELELDEEGVAVKGLLVRHLVLPGELSGTKKVLSFLADNLGKQTYVSLMSQYFPAHKAPDIPEVSRRITAAEYNRALEALEDSGLENGFAQDEYLEEE